MEGWGGEGFIKIVQLGEEKSMSQLKAANKAGVEKAAVIDKKASTTKEKPRALYWGLGENCSKRRPQSSKPSL